MSAALCYLDVDGSVQEWHLLMFLIAGIRLFRREGIASLAFTGAVGHGLMGSG